MTITGHGRNRQDAAGDGNRPTLLWKHFPGGVHFVPLSPLREPVFGCFAQSFRPWGSAKPGASRPSRLFKKEFPGFASRVPVLLLLDNFEHLLPATPTVADLLAIAPNLKILVTSRAALHIYGEHEFPVPALAVPDAHSKSSLESRRSFRRLRCLCSERGRQTGFRIEPAKRIRGDRNLRASGWSASGD